MAVRPPDTIVNRCWERHTGQRSRIDRRCQPGLIAAPVGRNVVREITRHTHLCIARTPLFWSSLSIVRVAIVAATGVTISNVWVSRSVSPPTASTRFATMNMRLGSAGPRGTKATPPRRCRRHHAVAPARSTRSAESEPPRRASAPRQPTVSASPARRRHDDRRGHRIERSARRRGASWTNHV
jgi:hypothetical protein